MTTDAEHVAQLAREIVAIADAGAEVTTGEHAAAQSRLASLGVELARLLLARPAA